MNDYSNWLLCEGLGDNDAALYRPNVISPSNGLDLSGASQYNFAQTRRRSLWIVCVSPAVREALRCSYPSKSQYPLFTVPPASRRKGRVFQRIAEVFSGQCNMTGEAPPERGDAGGLFFAIRARPHRRYAIRRSPPRHAIPRLALRHRKFHQADTAAPAAQYGTDGVTERSSPGHCWKCAG